MKTVSAADANRQFSSILRNASAGEEFVVVSRGRAVATIGPAKKKAAQGRSARKALMDRLRSQALAGSRSWTREALYDDPL
jgi:prevent-host-death family protein